MKTAILIDGGFYRVRARKCLGDKTPYERANELINYCYRHVCKRSDIYRIYYYDCPPLENDVYNPVTKTAVHLRKSDQYRWMNDFLATLSKKRKLALRLGTISDVSIGYSLKTESTKRLLNGKLDVSAISENDLKLNVSQKGVDMKIGIDIATLAFKKQADKIVLIAGDSDFVPAAKLARREGIDFVLDPLGAHITDDLSLHIDGLITKDTSFKG